ncbi:ADP-ribosylglycohydrolase [Paenibacillus sp. DS2015]|uniref:ADP-ribosylglycohydrolase family protein n=1 Tax=Paenibacillus sp. DS2015 TaxID=3373917 RepID=UPI003D1DF396
MINDDRFHGCFIGLAVGDALGTTVEFSAPGTFEPVKDIVGGGVFGLQPGQWTDDTSMALCIMESLLQCEGFDPEDQMRRYVQWFRKGHLSSTGTCFDIGNATKQALLQFERTGEAYCGSSEPFSAGNGSIMRLAPVLMYYVEDPNLAIEFAERSSRTTHAATECIEACSIMAAIIISGLHGSTKDEMLSPNVYSQWRTNQVLSKHVMDILAGSYKQKEPPMIQGTGYVIQSLEAALWAFFQSSSFEEGALLAVNLGNDADTTGAVYGQIAGAFYGYSGIPTSWCNKLAKKELMDQYIQELSSQRFRT